MQSRKQGAEMAGTQNHQARVSDEKAILGAVRNAQRNGGAQVKDVDAVAGASLGVEGIIELGRKALASKSGR